MPDDPGFDAALAHRWFSAHCFNGAWEFIDKPNPTPEEVVRMLGFAHASVWHWTQRTDCTPRNLSIGYWQLSRAYVVAGDAVNAGRFARACLDVTPAEETFCLAYAHEAAARAAALTGDESAVQEHLTDARRLAEAVSDDERSPLLTDLDTISSPTGTTQ